MTILSKSPESAVKSCRARQNFKRDTIDSKMSMIRNEFCPYRQNELIDDLIRFLDDIDFVGRKLSSPKIQSWRVAWKDIEAELIRLKGSAAAAIEEKEASKLRKKEVQVREKEVNLKIVEKEVFLKTQRMHHQASNLRVLSSTDGNNNLKAMESYNMLNTLEEIDGDKLNALNLNIESYNMSNTLKEIDGNKVDAFRDYIRSKHEVAIASSDNSVVLNRSNNETKVNLEALKSADRFSEERPIIKPSVRFGQVEETTFSQEPGNVSQLPAKLPIKLGDDVLSTRSYPCPTQSCPGRSVSQLRIGKTQREELYRSMPNEMLLKHTLNLELQQQALTKELQHVKSKNCMLEGRLNTAKTVLRNTGGDIADELYEKLATANSKNDEWEVNYKLLLEKNKANHEENKRFRHELQSYRGITVHPSKKDKARDRTGPPTWVQTYKKRKKADFVDLT